MANPLLERQAMMLFDHIRSDKHPSVTQMNMLEAIAPPRVLAAYTVHLMERLEADTNPSIPMMQRVERLAARWGP